MKATGDSIAKKIKEIRKSKLFDVRSDQLPTWCPGCGYFSIHFALNNAIQRLGIPHHMVTIVSGIGCAGRYPFFSNTYGLHTVHGRALPVSTGVKLAKPDLTVFAVGGDGDGLSIGGGHFPHAVRRDIDINYILFDNSIYGLTKGQPSSSTPLGFKTKVSPSGTTDKPLNATLMALSYGASFVARLSTADTDGITKAFIEGIQHKGFSFFHVYTPCVTFDKDFKTWNNLKEKLKPLPENFDRSDRKNTIEHVLSEDYSVGIIHSGKK
jgi:2-oxoglutarate ferredoxin oxidoreductase subunit beta